MHWEGNNNLYRTIQRIKGLEKRVGVVINPATPASVLDEVLRQVDLVLVMTINPGFGRQRFMPTTLPKIRQVRRMIAQFDLAASWNSTVASMRPQLRSEWRPEPKEPG